MGEGKTLFTEEGEKFIGNEDTSRGLPMGRTVVFFSSSVDNAEEDDVRAFTAAPRSGGVEVVVDCHGAGERQVAEKEREGSEREDGEEEDAMGIPAGTGVREGPMGDVLVEGVFFRLCHSASLPALTEEDGRGTSPRLSPPFSPNRCRPLSDEGLFVREAYNKENGETSPVLDATGWEGRRWGSTLAHRNPVLSPLVLFLFVLSPLSHLP